MCASAGLPVSAFQEAIRGGAAVLRDHICKEMNELNLERCRCIPKSMPGADWRVLQEIVEAHPERTLYKVLQSSACIHSSMVGTACILKIYLVEIADTRMPSPRQTSALHALKC